MGQFGLKTMRKRDKEPAYIPASMQEQVAKTLARYRSPGRPLATPARAATPPPDPANVTPIKTAASPEPPRSTPLRSPEYKRAKAMPSLESLPSADALPQMPQFAVASGQQGARHIDTQSTLDAGMLEQMSQISISEASGPSGLL